MKPRNKKMLQKKSFRSPSSLLSLTDLSGSTSAVKNGSVAFFESVTESQSCRLDMVAAAWSLSLDYSESRIRFSGGRFGDMMVTDSPMFFVLLQDQLGQESRADSLAKWGLVTVSHTEDEVVITLSDPLGISGISVELMGQTDAKGISWYIKVCNVSKTHTVMAVSYPTPELKGEIIHAFFPERSGRVILNAHEQGATLDLGYPGHLLSMPYFSYWGERGGIYLGVHDPDGSMKNFCASVLRDTASLTVKFPAIDSGNVGNSFDPGGYMRWETIEGDWYDATLIYADFVHNYAHWLPEKGRPDTDEKFKKISMWLLDYQRSEDMSAALMLREKLGYPIAAHSYFWHQIDFDTFYPHFLPAKDGTVERFTQMREGGIYVVPYINAVGWGTLDGDKGYEVNYDNTGVKGVAQRPDGTLFIDSYANPLAMMCPFFTPWRDIIKKLVRDMETTLPIDGVYFDQVAAVAPIPCSNPLHDHKPGGGSYWSDGYNEMILDIVSGRPKESFYFSESTGETYVKSFDGLLSWMWNLSDMVPAFSMVYAGYVQIVGRNSAEIGTENSFRYHFGEAMLFGQQPGWTPSGQYLTSPQSRIDYVKKIVDVRMKYIDLFNYGKIMRPPKIKTELEPVDGYRQVLSAVWQDEEKNKTVLFVINVSERPTTATLHLYPDEYGVKCPDIMEMELDPMSVKVTELNSFCAE